MSVLAATAVYQRVHDACWPDSPYPIDTHADTITREVYDALSIPRVPVSNRIRKATTGRTEPQ